MTTETISPSFAARVVSELALLLETGCDRSYWEPCQPSSSPASPQAGHHHEIRDGLSLRSTTSRPSHGRRPGRRRHGRAVLRGPNVRVAGAVAARDIRARYRAMRSAGPGASGSSSMPSKWRRSLTMNTSLTIVTGDRVREHGAGGRRKRAAQVEGGAGGRRKRAGARSG